MTTIRSFTERKLERRFRDIRMNVSVTFVEHVAVVCRIHLLKELIRWILVLFVPMVHDAVVVADDDGQSTSTLLRTLYRDDEVKKHLLFRSV